MLKLKLFSFYNRRKIQHSVNIIAEMGIQWDVATSIQIYSESSICAVLVMIAALGREGYAWIVSTSVHSGATMQILSRVFTMIFILLGMGMMIV